MLIQIPLDIWWLPVLHTIAISTCHDSCGWVGAVQSCTGKQWPPHMLMQDWTAESLIEDQTLLMRRKQFQAEEAKKKEEEAAKR